VLVCAGMCSYVELKQYWNGIETLARPLFGRIVRDCDTAAVHQAALGTQ
jgi:hypothetical protein